jgi:hypothetical protein
MNYIAEQCEAIANSFLWERPLTYPMGGVYMVVPHIEANSM